MTKNDIADVLNEIGTLLEMKDETPLKVRAYHWGGRVLERIEDTELATLIREQRLESVKGLGEALAQKISELHTAGRLKFYEELKASIAPGLVEMLQIPGLGAKKVRALHEKLGLDSIAGLAAACADGRVAELAGFGEKSQEKILTGIKNREAYGKRYLWWEAWELAEPILAGLRALPQVVRAEAAGSLRRGLETIGDLDFLVAASDVAPVGEWVTRLPEVQEETAQGETKSRRPNRASCRGWSNWAICAGRFTTTRRRPMGATRSRRWSARPRRWAGSISALPITPNRASRRMG